ncbi:MAG: peptidoglycan editing factor PgeF [Bryobacterales bacterium]|nr:peptidoglycan editing factor PgeF [Bryobacterales bacterium]
MFRCSDTKDYTAAALNAEPWLHHGFGTRESAWLTKDIATLKQVHSDRIAVVDGPRPEMFDEGDALVTRSAVVRLVIRTADCVPILLADPRQRAVAAVHAGWRGTASRIVAKTVDRMTADFGTRAADVVAAIGPSIGRCCYQVGPEVLEQLRTWVPELGQTAQHDCVNLPQINREQLLAVGVPDGKIFLSHLCTRCRAEDFHSFRRDKEQAGRMQSWIGIR